MQVPDFLLPLLDALIPPRPSERMVRTLTLRELCALSAPQTDGSFEALLPYHDPRAMALIWELKYRQNSEALSLAARLLEEPLSSIAGEEGAVPLIVPVPMHPLRLKQRGFNQTERLGAAVMARGFSPSGEYAPDILLRVRYARPQQGLPRDLRLRNAAHTMAVREPERVEGRTCIVIDDVATTGATLMEARRALTEAGARGVHCLALAA